MKLTTLFFTNVDEPVLLDSLICLSSPSAEKIQAREQLVQAIAAQLFSTNKHILVNRAYSKKASHAV